MRTNNSRRQIRYRLATIPRWRKKKTRQKSRLAKIQRRTDAAPVPAGPANHGAAAGVARLSAHRHALCHPWPRSARTELGWLVAPQSWGSANRDGAADGNRRQFL